MRFALTPDQTELRGAVAALLADVCPPEVVRRAAEGDRAGAQAAWAALTAMGVPAAALPEDAGGLGLDAGTMVGLLEETGRVALPLPVVETAFVAAPLLAPRPDLAAALVAGELLVACAVPGRDGDWLVPYGAVADVVLAPDGRLLGPGGAPIATTDGSRALTRLAADAAPASAPLAADGDAFERGALGTAAQLLGLGRRMLDLTVAYVQDRRQFGVPIGSFQAVRHALADALLALEFAAPAVLRAAWSLDTADPARARDVSMAKALASDAAERVGATALQCHGAMGYTVEYDLHLFLKRTWALAASWGDADWHRRRVAAALGLRSDVPEREGQHVR